MSDAPTVSAALVAQAIRERLADVPIKKLHRLLYYCQGHHLAMLGSPMFRETISAWDMGPVVGRLWHAERTGSEDAPSGETLGERELNTVGYVLSRYGALTGRDLENLTHAELPWRRADESRPPGQSVRIELEWMVEYFRHDSDDDDAQGFPLDAGAVRDWLADAPGRRQAVARADTREAVLARLVSGA